MNKIDEFFEKYPNNIIGFRVNGNNKVIDFWLDSEWTVDLVKEVKNLSIKKQKSSDDNKSIYYVLFSDKLDFNSMYKVFCDIMEHNLDMERKKDLYVEKLTELRDLFDNLTYDELKKIQFKKPKTTRSSQNNKEEEMTLEESHEVD